MQDPLHGITLKMIVTELVQRYGFAELGKRIRINCFVDNPSIASSLKFLRRTPWARKKVEELYLQSNNLQKNNHTQNSKPTAPNKSVWGAVKQD